MTAQKTTRTKSPKGEKEAHNYQFSFWMPPTLMERIRSCVAMEQIVHPNRKKISMSDFLTDLVTRELDRIEPGLRKQLLGGSKNS